MIELLEPPPSTWFDDLDSDPVPLSKRRQNLRSSSGHVDSAHVKSIVPAQIRGH
jgi:hypothetical protein